LRRSKSAIPISEPFSNVEMQIAVYLIVAELLSVDDAHCNTVSSTKYYLQLYQ